MSDPIWLNLACGTDIREPPWRNLDVVHKWPAAIRACDEIWDARKDKLNYADNSVEAVYAGHLFLHLAPQYHQPVLADIWRVLQPGGTLIIVEVEMDKVLAKWIEDPSDPRLAELIWGEQGYLPGAPADQQALAEFDKHCHGYTEKTLFQFMAAGGFRELNRMQFHSGGIWYAMHLIGRK